MNNELYVFVSLRDDNTVFDIYISYRGLHIVSLLVVVFKHKWWFLVNLAFQRISETVDTEIRRWATGKEGNMRALLSSLHIVSFE